MSKFIELGRASMIVRVKNAIVKNHANGSFEYMSDAQKTVEAEKLAVIVVDAARKIFCEKMNNPLIALGDLTASIESRETVAILTARDMAAKAYFKTSNEGVAIPEFLGVAMGFFELPTAKSIQKLEQAGIALYGSRWQTELAASLKNADGKSLDARRIRQWLAGDYATPEWIWPQIKQLAEHRKQQIDELIGKL